ncbi:MAG: D-alanyl-D-alanine carboxypeptidase [Solirubrobacterales bacterium]|nr:D-alanyl-D-alanine carboxypeptidase [Solirubrobacterales bacterium]
MRSRRARLTGSALVAAAIVVLGAAPGSQGQKPEAAGKPAKPAAGDKPAKPAGQKPAKKKKGEAKPPKGEKSPRDVVGPPIDSRAWILIDARDGEVLASGSPDRPLPIASATKLMTAELALKELPPNKLLTAPAYDALKGESILGLSAGEKMSTRDLLYALLLPSANDAAETLAIGAAGNERRFVAEMNRRARLLGLDNTHYANPIGLDDPNNYSTARDVTTLAGNLLERPLLARIVNTQSALLKTGAEPRRIESRNTLLASEPWVTGVKTGHTLGAGYVLVGSANVDGASLISAVLGARSESARDADTLKLLNYGASLYKPKASGERGEKFASPQLDYRDEQLSLVAAKSFKVAARKGQKVETTVDAPDEVSGKIKKGQPLGRVLVTVDGNPAAKVALLAATGEPAASFKQKLTHTLSNPFILIPVALFAIVVIVLLARRGRRAVQDHRVAREEAKVRTPDDRRQMHQERMRRRQERASRRRDEDQ